MSHKPLLLLYCVLLGLTPACAKMASSESSRSPESYGGGSSGGDAQVSAMEEPMADAGYDFAKKDLEAENMRPEGAAVPTVVAAAPARVPAGGAPTSTPPEGKIAEPTPKPADAREGKGEPASDEAKKQFARQIIYTAEMQVSVYKLDDAMARAEELTLAAGGYVQNMAQGYYVLRIPAPALRGVMDDLAKLGVVEARTLQARDVSEEYVDLTTRIRVLRETQQQLLILLKQARNVDEALKVRQSVDQITMELEQAMGRLRYLESQIGFSTLTVRMSQRGPQNTIPSSNDPFPWVDGLGVEATEWN